ncbi:MAG: hypothetical protein E7A62_00580 [Actinomycetaceae bacterium]|nr:hypothetical protein [Actinomycetaceae bacterium]MDU0969473.1 hypothetical protein [Actinomycetaceae bacterium]
MKRTIIVAGVVAASAAVAWSIPPVRARIVDTYTRFSELYHDREAQIRSALLDESDSRTN